MASPKQSPLVTKCLRRLAIAVTSHTSPPAWPAPGLSPSAGVVTTAVAFGLAAALDAQPSLGISHVSTFVRRAQVNRPPRPHWASLPAGLKTNAQKLFCVPFTDNTVHDVNLSLKDCLRKIAAIQAACYARKITGLLSGPRENGLPGAWSIYGKIQSTI